jgi:hypothetical protein
MTQESVSLAAAHRKGEGPSPRVYARIAGVLYLITIVLGAAGQFAFRGRIVVPGNPAATAANLRSMESLWRLGIAAEMVLLICTIVTVLILYALLRPVRRDLALLMVFFGLVALTIEASHSLDLVEALQPVGKAAYLKAFTPEQLDVMAALSIRKHSASFGIALLFFGPYFLVAGYLIFKSGYFPRALGVLYLIPGPAYLISSFALILAPAFASRYYFVMVSPVILGEGALCLYLLVKGVRASSWEDLEAGP